MTTGFVNIKMREGSAMILEKQQYVAEDLGGKTIDCNPRIREVSKL